MKRSRPRTSLTIARHARMTRPLCGGERDPRGLRSFGSFLRAIFLHIVAIMLPPCSRYLLVRLQIMLLCAADKPCLRGVDHVTDRNQSYRWTGPAIAACQRLAPMDEKLKLDAPTNHSSARSHIWIGAFCDPTPPLSCPACAIPLSTCNLNYSGRRQDTSALFGHERQLHAWEIAPICPSSELCLYRCKKGQMPCHALFPTKPTAPAIAYNPVLLLCSFAVKSSSQVYLGIRSFL